MPHVSLRRCEQIDASDIADRLAFFRDIEVQRYVVLTQIAELSEGRDEFVRRLVDNKHLKGKERSVDLHAADLYLASNGATEVENTRLEIVLGGG